MKDKSHFEELDKLARHLASPNPDDPDEIRECLESDGVDVENYLATMKKLFRTEFHSSMKALKTQEAKLPTGVTQKLLGWTRDQLEEYLEKARQGLFGDEASAMAAACYRNKTGAEMEEEEIRSLVEDIMSSTGED